MPNPPSQTPTSLRHPASRRGTVAHAATAAAIACLLAAGPVSAQDMPGRRPPGGNRSESLKPPPQSTENNQGGAGQPAQNAGANDAGAGAQQGRQGRRGRANREAAAGAANRTAPAAGAAKGALGEFSVVSTATSRLMRIHSEGSGDRQDKQVTIGDEFITEISLRNPDLAPFDELRVLLSYEPDFLEPLSINDSIIASSLRGEPTSELDPLFGQILYEARLAKPLVLNDSPVLSIRWRAKKVTYETRLEFGQKGDIFTAVVGDGKDLLGNPAEPGDGTLNMSVTVLPEDPREAHAMLTDPRTFDPGSVKLGGARLFLKPQSDPVVVDEPFFVDLVFDNRAFSMVDSVSAVISYDPEVLTVLDADWNNWITLGLNIHDGPFRENFPWNYHVDNTVFSRRGQIVYRVGTDEPETVRGNVGTIARIYAVARRPTGGTAMRFTFPERNRDRGTGVTFLGEDALGTADNATDGAQGVVLTINPSPRPTTTVSHAK